MDKINFYDTLGFLLPGALLMSGLVLLNVEFEFYNLSAIAIDEKSFFFQLLLTLIAYLAGMLLHQLSLWWYQNHFETPECRVWKLKWVTKRAQTYEGKKKGLQFLEFARKVADDVNNIDFSHQEFQQYVFRKLTVALREQKPVLLIPTQAQRTMFLNSSLAFFILTPLSLCYCFWGEGVVVWVELLKVTLPLIVLGVLCFYLAIERQKAVIRDIFHHIDMDKVLENLKK